MSLDGLQASRPGGEGDGLASLYRLTDGLFRARALSDVYDAALEAITTVLGPRASILLFDNAGSMRFVAWRGLSAGYRFQVDGHSPWRLGDRDAQPIFVEDTRHLDEPPAIVEAIELEGIRALGFIPIFDRGAIIGKFMTYYDQPHHFTGPEADLAVTIARQVGFALERRAAEAAREHALQDLFESEQRFRLMSEQAPVMIWMSDPNGRCLLLNALLRQFWNVSEDSIASFDWTSTLHADDVGLVSEAMKRAVLERKATAVEGRYRNASGEYRLLRTEARPRFSAAGDFLGLVGVNIDRTERQKSEEALKESEERLRVALAAGRMGTWRYDLSTGKQVWDRRQYELFGLAPDREPTRELFLALVHPEDKRSVLFDPHTLAGDTFLDSEFRIVRADDGRVRWITAHSIARIDRAGRPIEMIGVNFDVTDLKENERRLELLVRELNHRVKNTLAVIQAIARQSFGAASDPVEALRAFEGRLIALARAHNRLTQSSWESMSLSQLAGDILHTSNGDIDRIALAGPEIALSPKQAVSISLVLHELLTNTLKYGALSVPSGHVSVKWRVALERIEIDWVETGGPRVVHPTRKGFGTRLIERSLVMDLDGLVSLDFEPQGVHCFISVPLHKPGGNSA